MHSAATVAEALCLADRHACGLLISDLGLPDGSGLELMRRMRSRHPHTQGIALTGFTSPEDEQSCIDAGFVKFLPKPVSYVAILTGVERLVANGPSSCR